MRGRMPRGFVAVLLLHLILGPFLHPLSAAPADLCIEGANTAANRYGVPRDVLLAITLTETGRGDPAEPWPWAINVAGESHWFPDRPAALAFARRTLATGQRNFDVGCFQLNYRWHGENFATLEAMFSPQDNADYAAAFLRRLHPETGDWSRAAGAYHSRTPVHATRYRARFDTYLAQLRGSAPPPSVSQAGISRTNSYPLLQPRGGTARLGSLLPLGGDG